MLPCHTQDPLASVLPPQLENVKVVLEAVPRPVRLLCLAFQMLQHPNSSAWELVLGPRGTSSLSHAIMALKQQQQQEEEEEAAAPDCGWDEVLNLAVSNPMFLQLLSAAILGCEERVARAAAVAAAAAAAPLGGADPSSLCLVSLPAVNAVVNCC
jgi:hypothetical protein